MRNNTNETMRNNCRYAMSTVPGVDRETLRDISEMRLRSANAEADTNITESLLEERDSVRREFRSWLFD